MSPKASGRHFNDALSAHYNYGRALKGRLMGFPARLGLGGRLLEVDVLVHMVDPGER